MLRDLAIYELKSPDIPESAAGRTAGENRNRLRVRETMTARMGGSFKAME